MYTSARSPVTRPEREFAMRSTDILEQAYWAVNTQFRLLPKPLSSVDPSLYVHATVCRQPQLSPERLVKNRLKGDMPIPCPENNTNENFRGCGSQSQIPTPKITPRPFVAPPSHSQSRLIEIPRFHSAPPVHTFLSTRASPFH